MRESVSRCDCFACQVPLMPKSTLQAYLPDTAGRDRCRHGIWDEWGVDASKACAVEGWDAVPSGSSALQLQAEPASGLQAAHASAFEAPPESIHPPPGLIHGAQQQSLHGLLDTPPGLGQEPQQNGPPELVHPPPGLGGVLEAEQQQPVAAEQAEPEHPVQGQLAEQAEQARPRGLVEVDSDYFLQNKPAMLRWKGHHSGRDFSWLCVGKGGREERQQEEREARQIQREADVSEAFWRRDWGHEGFDDLYPWMKDTWGDGAPPVREPRI